MIRYAVAILLLALTMPASAEDMNDANSILPGCKGTPWHADVGARALRRIY
jgi:hypothetical protein